MTEIELEIKKHIDLVLIVRFGNHSESANDIDLLIVSDDFVGMAMNKRIDLIKSINDQFDPICLTRDQYALLKSTDSSLYKSVVNNGKVLYGFY